MTGFDLAVMAIPAAVLAFGVVIGFISEARAERDNEE